MRPGWNWATWPRPAFWHEKLGSLAVDDRTDDLRAKQVVLDAAARLGHPATEPLAANAGLKANLVSFYRWLQTQQVALDQAANDKAQAITDFAEQRNRALARAKAAQGDEISPSGHEPDRRIRPGGRRATQRAGRILGGRGADHGDLGHRLAHPHGR